MAMNSLKQRVYHSQLGGGLKDFWNFHPDVWGKWSNLTIIFFQMGCLKPPTRKLRLQYLILRASREMFIHPILITNSLHTPNSSPFCFPTFRKKDDGLLTRWAQRKPSYKCNEVITPVNRLTYNPQWNLISMNPIEITTPFFLPPISSTPTNPTNPTATVGISDDRSPSLDVEETEATWSSWRYFWHTWKQGTTNHLDVSLNGGFPPISHPKSWSFLVGKPMVVGETHHFRKPPFGMSRTGWNWSMINDQWWSALGSVG